MDQATTSNVGIPTTGTPNAVLANSEVIMHDV